MRREILGVDRVSDLSARLARQDGTPEKGSQLRKIGGNRRGKRFIARSCLKRCVHKETAFALGILRASGDNIFEKRDNRGQARARCLDALDALAQGTIAIVIEGSGIQSAFSAIG